MTFNTFQNPYLSSFGPSLQALEFQAEMQEQQGIAGYQQGAQQQAEIQQFELQQQMQAMQQAQMAQAQGFFPGQQGIGGFQPGFQQGMQQAELQQIQQQMQQMQQAQSLQNLEQLLQAGMSSFQGPQAPTAPAAPIAPSAATPTSQAAGVQSPDTVMAGGGVTTGLTDVGGQGTPPWPAGTTETPGGYYIVPSSQIGNGQGAGVGLQGFTIYGPKPDGTKPAGLDSSFAMTGAWGDPHMTDANGNQIFEFSANSDMRLPDGTTLSFQNASSATGQASQTGATEIQKIDIQNGNSHISFNWTPDNTTGSYSQTSGHYVSSGDTGDGVNWMTQHLSSTNWSHDTFNLALDAQGNPSFYEYVNNQDMGKVTGNNFEANGTADPIVDSSNTNYAVASQYAPQPGTPAYGNMLFNQSLETFADPKYQGNLPANVIQQIIARWGTDVAQTQQGLTGANALPDQAPAAPAAPAAPGAPAAPAAPAAPTTPPSLPGIPANQYFGGINPQMMPYLMMMFEMRQSLPQINYNQYNQFNQGIMG
jgi:hypothetical protein